MKKNNELENKEQESTCVADSINVFVDFFEINNMDSLRAIINRANVLKKNHDSLTYEYGLEHFSLLMNDVFEMLKKAVEKSNYEFKNKEKEEGFWEKFDELKKQVVKEIENYHKKEDSFRFGSVANLINCFMEEEFPKLMEDLSEFKLSESCAMIVERERTAVESVI